MFYVLVTL